MENKENKENKESSFNESMQPKLYSAEELKKLKEFVETVKNDEARAAKNGKGVQKCFVLLFCLQINLQIIPRTLRL